MRLESGWIDAVHCLQEIPLNRSFMHLHLGFDARGLEGLEMHHIVVNSWEGGVDTEQASLKFKFDSDNLTAIRVSGVAFDLEGAFSDIPFRHALKPRQERGIPINFCI